MRRSLGFLGFLGALMCACGSSSSGGDHTGGGTGAGASGGSTGGSGTAAGGKGGSQTGAGGHNAAGSAGHAGGASTGGSPPAGTGGMSEGPMGGPGTGGMTAGPMGAGTGGMTAGPMGPGAGGMDPGPGAGGMGDAGTSSGAGGDPGGLVTYGQPYTMGQYNLGPVDYAESQFHNACAPGTKYDPKVQAVEGTFLAGLWNGIPNIGGYCDSCIWVTTDMGKSAMLRVVTYGDTSTNSIDTSPEAYAALNLGEYPRGMTWQFAKCPESGPMMYEFQTGANQWWTSLWVRNARVPVAKVEVMSANHAAFVELQRGGDGTLTDGSGFGMGPFSIRTTGVDGQTVTENFDWPSPDIAGAFLTGTMNFQ